MWRFFLGIKLPYDPAIPLLGIYHEKNRIEKDAYTPMFTSGRFTIARIARTWKQLRCTSTGEWIKKLWVHTMEFVIYTLEYHSAIKRNKS